VNLLVAMNKNLNLQASILFVCLLVLFHSGVLEELFGFSKGVAQYALLVPVLITLGLYSFHSFRFPKWALLLTLVCSGLMGIAFLKLNSKPSLQTKVLVSPFSKDANQVQSIKFQDLLAKDFKRKNSSTSIINLPNPVTDLKSAQKLFSEYKTDISLIGGSSRWLSLYFSKNSSDLLKSEANSNLNIANWISAVGLSDSTDPASREFVAIIITAQHALSNNDFLEAELLLSEAASVVGTWTTPAHRAYPLWLLGTLYLHKFQANPQDKAHLTCALDYLSRARRFIHNKATPELLAAILNNRAIAHFNAYLYFGKKDYKKKAFRDLGVAVKAKPKSTDPAAWATAKENLWILKNSKLSKKKKKKKGKKNALVSKVKNS
jgi:hypothetical protein